MELYHQLLFESCFYFIHFLLKNIWYQAEHWLLKGNWTGKKVKEMLLEFEIASKMMTEREKK